MVLACAASPTRERVAPSAEFPQLERQVARLVNEHRVTRRLARLTFDTGLATIARAHSGDMAARRVPLGHDRFEERAELVGRDLPFLRIAENVALNDYAVDRTVAVALRGWLRSPHHLENIEGSYNLTGVGIVRAKDGTFYYTQLFVARRQ
jgi:uncharacterized protein YkwD